MLINIIKHLNTILRHKREVLKNAIKAGIVFQGLMHDMSKFSPTEFFEGIKYYQGNRSLNEMEREMKGYSEAWMHHKGRNKHHFEYWTDYNIKTKRIEPIEMPLNYVVEMFCDRVAASKIYGGKEYNDRYALNYYLNGKERRVIHKKTGELIESLLFMLAEKGERETFLYIRNLLKEAKL